jgi:glutamine synthetase type III
VGGFMEKVRDAQVFEDFFPEAIRIALVEELESGDLRKREFYFGQNLQTVPRSLTDASAFASDRLGLRFNFAILKWYRLSDDYESQAYEVHRDPDHLTSIPLVLCTLKGQADLVYWTSSGVEARIRCRPNALVMLNSELVHRVTPPLGPEGERYLLFLGFDTSLPNAGTAGG